MGMLVQLDHISVKFKRQGHRSTANIRIRVTVRGCAAPGGLWRMQTMGRVRAPVRAFLIAFLYTYQLNSYLVPCRVGLPVTLTNCQNAAHT